jgi:hypothetical protein
MLTSEWETLYRAAILETDESKVEERIEVAEFAMHARLQEFSLNHGGTLEENRAIADALNGLDILRSGVASWRSSRPTAKAQLL